MSWEPVTSSGWQEDTSASEWKEDTSGGWGTSTETNGDDGGFGESSGQGLGDDGPTRCRNCDQEGHMARECPEPRRMTGECYNCGEVGHNKADCPNPKVARPFTGECRICHQEGHPAAECPEKPPEKCRICGQEGHKAINCASKRLDVFSEDLLWSKPDEAWDAMAKADQEQEVDEFKKALLAYAKAMLGLVDEEGGTNPGIDLSDLEKGFRAENRNFYLIAKEREIPETLTIVGLNGLIDQKYVLTFAFSSKAPRKKFLEGWPASPEENLERLKSCGFPMDRLVPKCDNCGQMGHIRKHCKKQKAEPQGRVVITCVICNETGHRARDCAQPRVDPHLCRNCKQPGHKASECTEPRDTSDVECKRCGEMGHFGRDCPKSTSGPMTCHNCGEEGHKAAECEKPKNPANFKCRNCDEVGHFSRDCPKPRDWSKVQCRNCGEYGHTIVKCPKPKGEEPEEVDFGAEGGWVTTESGGNGGWNVDASNDGGWNSSHVDPVGAW